MSQATFRRARRPEQKRERRDAILRAAHDLAARSRVRDVSLSHIAAAVGLAKSNVVRYFGTREEIYLALTVQQLRGFEQAVLDRLAQPDGPADVVAALTDALEQRPLLCDLIGECTSTLERNVSLDAAREYKLDMIRLTRDLGAAIAKAHPSLSENEGTELVGAAAALAGMLYPIVNASPVLEQLRAQDPVIAAAHLEFVPTMDRALRALAAGLPTLRDSE
jgi:AcrR family transcriptional regulator